MAVDYSRVYGVELVPNGDPSRVIPVQAPRGIPYVLAQSGIPMILPSSGTIGNNGALSAITALPTTFSGGCYMYFPANAIAAGVAAGLYWVVMSSTTAGTIYNNTYTSGTPAAPTSLTAFATTGPGAYTQTTASDITLFTTTIPAGALGTNGALISEPTFIWANTAGNKVHRQRVSTTTIQQNTDTTNVGIVRSQTLRATLGRLTSINSASGNNSVGGAIVYIAEDQANGFNLNYTSNLAVATDFGGIVGFSIQIVPTES